MSCSYVLQRGQSGVVWLIAASTLYDVRKGDLFVVIGCDVVL